eukprot:scaffold65206_cov31-Tisochrysis_lutea.AAC.4
MLASLARPSAVRLGSLGYSRLSRRVGSRMVSTPPGGRPNATAQQQQHTAWERLWAWTTQPRPSWKENGVEAIIICTVFAVTGSTSVAVVRPFLKHTIGLEGSMREGPWSYRIFSLLLVSPIYATLLVTFGTAAGRHTFFASMARKIFGRFLPPALARRVGCGPAQMKASPPP